MLLRVSCLIVLGVLPCAEARAESETLQEAWIGAYGLNPSLQSERAKLRATDEQVSQALSHWRPSVDATASIGKTWQYLPQQETFGLDPNFTGTARSYGVQLTQPLFRGFRTLTETEAAEKQVLASRARLEDAEQQLFIDTGTAFLDLIRDQAVLASDIDNEHVLEKKLDETRARAKLGDLTQTDIRQAETRLARAHVARFQAETSVEADRASYMRLVGRMPEKLVRPTLTFEMPKDSEDLAQQAENSHPKVIAARYDIEEAKAEVDFNKGSLLPEINLVGSRTQNWRENITAPGQQDSSQVVIQATMPLYRSGTDYSRARAAEQTVTQRRMDLEEARHKAREAAHNALQSFRSSEAAVEADKDEIHAAELALEGVRQESKVGTRTTLDVLNAEQELLDAKTDEAKAEHDRDLAVLQIQAAIGTLTADQLHLPVALYDAALHYDDVRDQWLGFSASDERYAVHGLKMPPMEAAAAETPTGMLAPQSAPREPVLTEPASARTESDQQSSQLRVETNFNKPPRAEETATVTTPAPPTSSEPVPAEPTSVKEEPHKEVSQQHAETNFNKPSAGDEPPAGAALAVDQPPRETPP